MEQPNSAVQKVKQRMCPMRLIIFAATSVATKAPKKYTEVSTPRYLSEKPSATPRNISKVLKRLLPSKSKNMALNRAVIEMSIERM